MKHQLALAVTLLLLGMNAPNVSAAQPGTVQGEQGLTSFAPLSEEDCLALKSLLEEALEREAFLRELTVAGDAKDGTPFACEAVVTSTDERSEALLNAPERLQDALAERGWKRDNQHVVSTPSGTVMTFTQDEALALLTTTSQGESSLVSLVGTQPTSGSANAGSLLAALRARQVLVQELDVPSTSVMFVGAEHVEWPNACLGAARGNELCAQMITPGYRVTLEVNGETHVLHTDEAGHEVRLVS